MKEFRLLYLIGDIQDKFILEAAQEQQDTRRGGFSKKFRYCALGLCAAMALCAGLKSEIRIGRCKNGYRDDQASF